MRNVHFRSLQNRFSIFCNRVKSLQPECVQTVRERANPTNYLIPFFLDKHPNAWNLDGYLYATVYRYISVYFGDNLDSRSDRGLREHIIDDTNLSTNRESSEVISWPTSFHRMTVNTNSLAGANSTWVAISHQRQMKAIVYSRLFASAFVRSDRVILCKVPKFIWILLIKRIT